MSKREEVRQKILTVAVNEALAQNIFTLNENDDTDDSLFQESGGEDYEFVAFGYVCKANARGIGWGEISLVVLIQPESQRYFLSGWLGSMPRARRASKAIAAACGWLERRCGNHIQDSGSSDMYSGGNAITEQIYKTEVIPNGFKTSGRLFL